MDLYAVANYPKAEFHNEVELQRAVTSRRKTIDRRLVWGFGSWVAIFFTAILFGFLGLPAVTLTGLVLLFILFLPLAFTLIYDPALDCPHCGKRLKKDWAILPSERSGKFLICPSCHIYVYTHRTLR